MSKYEQIKKRIFEIIEASNKSDMAGKAYDIMILIAVIIGLIPLTLKESNPYTNSIDIITSILFLVDYIIRLWTADYKMGIKSYKAYVAYFLTPLAIIDFLSIIPVLTIIFPTIKTLQFIRIVRVFRLFKLVRYSKTMVMIENIFRKIKSQLFAIIMLVFVYILACSMIIFQVEPDMFETFFDAIYWSTVSITTVGYGDIAPTSVFGRVITVISSLVGVGVIALPAALITAAYIDEIRKKKGKHEL